MEWVRCRKCKTVLFRCSLEPGSIVEIKCRKCDEMNLITPTGVAAALISDGQGGYILTKPERRAIMESIE